MARTDLININTPNKDILISFVYAWTRQKEMSILEQRVILRILEYASYRMKGLLVKENKKRVSLGLKNVKVRIPVAEVLFNTKMKHIDIENALYNLRKRTFEYKNGDVYTVCGFINNATYTYRSGIIEVEVDNKIWNVLSDFTLGFRRFELNKALVLPTSYSLRFYILLSGEGNPFMLRISDMKSWLGIPEDSYKRNGKDRIDHIESRILKPTQKLLRERCPWTFTYKKIRESESNSKSPVIGFFFQPVYLPRNRDVDLEGSSLKSQIPAAVLIGHQMKDYMLYNMHIPSESINRNKNLLDEARKILPDPMYTLSNIQGRRRKSDGTYMGIGWVIEAIRGEVEGYKKSMGIRGC